MPGACWVARHFGSRVTIELAQQNVFLCIPQAGGEENTYCNTDELARGAYE